MHCDIELGYYLPSDDTSEVLPAKTTATETMGN